MSHTRETFIGLPIEPLCLEHILTECTVEQGNFQILEFPLKWVGQVHFLESKELLQPYADKVKSYLRQSIARYVKLINWGRMSSTQETFNWRPIQPLCLPLMGGIKNSLAIRKGLSLCPLPTQYLLLVTHSTKAST